MQIRPADAADLPAITAIYAHHVRTGCASFELDPPTLVEMRERFDGILAGSYPYLVATDGAQVLGYAYANAYRARPAYRFTVEDSIYLDPAAAGRGIGKALLNALIERCEAGGWRQMLAVIGDSGNAASIGVHRACGFTLKCTLDAVGFKFDRWVDSVIMQRKLGEADRSPPADTGVRP